MAIAQGSSSKIGMVAETVWGTTPSTPAFTTIPVTDFSVNLSKDEFEDTSIQGDRMQRYSLSGNRTVTGDMSVLMAPINYDSLLESVVSGTWNTNVLKVGSTRKSFTVEHAQEDIGVYIPYTGVVVDKASFSVNTTGVVTGQFSLVGKDGGVADVSSLDADGYTAATTALPFTHVSGTFNEGGSAIGLITSIQFTIDNGYSTNYALGNVGARDLSGSFVKCEGTVSAYFESATLLNKFINGTSSSLDFTLSNGTNTLKVEMPNTKYTGASKSLSGSGPVVLSMPFKALYHTGSGSIVTFTRT